MTPIIRMATVDDADAIQALYAPYVRDTVISFETEAPDRAEIRRCIENVLTNYPWIVCEAGGTLLGYAYASRFHPRAAFQWTVETSVYVAPEWHRHGIARGLYTTLLALLRTQGLVNAIAAISVPNEASVALHEAFGFQFARQHTATGFKHGAWRDVGYWQLTLQPHPENPAPPKAISTLHDSPAFAAALVEGIALFRI